MQITTHVEDAFWKRLPFRASDMIVKCYFTLMIVRRWYLSRETQKSVFGI